MHTAQVHSELKTMIFTNFFCGYIQRQDLFEQMVTHKQKQKVRNVYPSILAGIWTMEFEKVRASLEQDVLKLEKVRTRSLRSHISTRCT